MKKILIPTDFSANATHAAEYGYNLASILKANIVLCNACIVPAEMPQAGVIVWPMEEYDIIEKETTDELQQLKNRLEKKDNSSYKPLISLVNEIGAVTDVVDGLIKLYNIDLIVMGTHGTSGLSTLLLGNHSRKMIDATTKPLLLVPAQTKITPVKKIAFATDFKHPQDDLAAIYALIPFAKLLGAEILLTHVYNEKHHSPQFQKWLDDLLVDLSNKADYPNIYYRIVKNSNPENGLSWLCKHGQVDMLAMLHRPHNFFDTIIQGSHTKKMADHISIPLLVFPTKIVK